MKKFNFPNTKKMRAFARDEYMVYFFNPSYSTLEGVSYEEVTNSRDNPYHRSRSTVYRLPFLMEGEAFMFNGKEIPEPGFNVFYLED